MTLEALVFDLDGTFVDTDELHRRAFNQAFLEFELGFDWKPDMYEKLLTVSGGADRIRHFIDGCPLSQEQKLALQAVVPAVHREKTRIYGELLENNAAKLRSGVRRLMAEARQAGLEDRRCGDLGIGQHAAPDSVGARPARGVRYPGLRVRRSRGSGKSPRPTSICWPRPCLACRPSTASAFEDSTNGVLAAKAAGIVHDRDAKPLDPLAGFLARGCLPERTR